MLWPFEPAGKRWTRPRDKVNECSQCAYEAAERCSKPKTALARLEKSNRKESLEISYWKIASARRVTHNALLGLVEKA